MRERSPTPIERTKTGTKITKFEKYPVACVCCLFALHHVGVCVCVCHRILSVLVFAYKVRWGEGHTSRVAVAWPLATSQSRAVLSLDPVASVRPSGVKATLVTQSVWPWCVVEGKRERRAREATAQG